MSLATQVSALATAIGNTLRDSYKPRLLPAGGVAGQVLTKNTGTNYDAAWAAANTAIWRVLQADAAGSNATGAQPLLPGAAAINLAAATTYEYEMLVSMTRAAGAVSHTVSLLFAGTATLTAINGIESVGNPTGNVLSAAGQEIMARAAAAQVVTAANVVATEELRIWQRGILVTLAAGTFIPQFSYSAAPGGAPTVKRGSFVRFAPLGNATVVSLN